MLQGKLLYANIDGRQMITTGKSRQGVSTCLYRASQREKQKCQPEDSPQMDTRPRQQDKPGHTFMTRHAANIPPQPLALTPKTSPSLCSRARATQSAGKMKSWGCNDWQAPCPVGTLPLAPAPPHFRVYHNVISLLLNNTLHQWLENTLWLFQIFWGIFTNKHYVW